MLSVVKVLSVAEAQKHLDSVCEQALAGEVIRLQLANGALVELSPVPPLPIRRALSAAELAACYEGPDADWARFENNCAKSSD